MKRIESISEAFSVEPREHHVSTEYELSLKYSGVLHINSIEGKYNSDGTAVYIGYDINGNELFQWIAAACNVEYFSD